MFWRTLWLLVLALALGLLASVGIGYFLLPSLLLQAPLPQRSEIQRARIRQALCPPGSRWERITLEGGQSKTLEAWWLHRSEPRGLALILHGFGDDAWGSAPWCQSLEEYDAFTFTFRGRDRDPRIPCTLGAWEREDVGAAVRHLLARGQAPKSVFIVASSMGSGVALLSLADLEARGILLGGALLECPFLDLREAARNHLRGSLGPAEILLRPAQWIALRRAGQLAGFDPQRVAPLEASKNLRTPIALLTGDRDPVTPLEGVQAIAQHHPDLTIVPGAGHCEAGARIPGGWRNWAFRRLDRWSLL